MILKSLREVSLFVKNSREDFYSLVSNGQEQRQEDNLKEQKKKLASYCDPTGSALVVRQRYNELDKLIRRIYEDNVSGKLSDRRFSKLSDEYEGEQEDVDQEIEELENILDTEKSQAVNLEEFVALFDRYTDFTTLTTPMLNEFVEKVVVHERVKGYRRTVSQDIELHFNFVGRLTLPSEKIIKVPSMKTEHELSTCAKRKYANLISFMEQQTESRINLTFQELEGIIGEKLGQSYYTYFNIGIICINSDFCTISSVSTMR